MSTVLVVEDSVAEQEMMKDLLQNSGLKSQLLMTALKR